MIRFENVSLSAARKHGTVHLLRDISFAVPAGKLVGVVGESGAGKSMLGRLISGLIPPGFQHTQGHIYVNQTDITTLPPKQHQALLGRKLAFIPQEPLTALNPLLTIGQSFSEQLRIIGIPNAAHYQHTLQALTQMELPNPVELMARYPHQLSGGQCQRVLIAMAFAAQPELIIADEPTTALDVMSQANVMRILASLQKKYGTSVMLITHDLIMASHVCDEIVVLYAGEVVESGQAHQLLTHPKHPYTRALLKATPRLSGERVRLPTLEGFMPSINDLATMTGCRFAPRCEHAAASCLAQTIAWHQDEKGGLRCLHPDAASPTSDALPALPTLQLDTTTSPALLKVANLSLHYRSPHRSFRSGKTNLTLALDNVSFQVQAGECVGIVGESGSGKSSLARAIMGMHEHCTGHISIDGIPVLGARGTDLQQLRRTAQIIFQDPHSALNPRRSVYSLLTQGMEAMPPEQRLAHTQNLDERLRQLNTQVRLSPSMLQRYPAELSGGQKQRVNIGRGVFLTPKLLVADEIVSGLDMSVQAQILNLLRDLAQQHGIAIVLISHDLAVVRYLCQRVIVMHRGQAVEQGLVDEVFNTPTHDYTRRLLRAVPSGDPLTAPWPPEELYA